MSEIPHIKDRLLPIRCGPYGHSSLVSILIATIVTWWFLCQTMAILGGGKRSRRKRIQGHGSGVCMRCRYLFTKTHAKAVSQCHAPVSWIQGVECFMIDHGH